MNFGRYRRAFDWRLTTSDRVPAEVATFAIRKLGLPEHLELLEEFLSISRRRRNNRMVLARLQSWLLTEIRNDEHSVKGLKKLAEENNISLDHGESPALKDAASKAVANGLFFHRAHANCIRQIVDGIAWRSFGYDQAVMRLLSERATKQQTLSEGTEHELREWARTFDSNNGIAILNALTNVLAVGDITVVKPDGSGEIIEIKASKNVSRRLTRQKQKMREVVELLNCGQGEIEDRTLTIFRVDIFPENDLNVLLKLLERASLDGWSAGRINACCYVECINTTAIKNAQDAIARLKESANAEAEVFVSEGDVVDVMNSLDVLAFTPNCMPFSIFPFPPKRCVELMTGIASYRSFFNRSAFFRELEQSGWKFKRKAAQIIAESGGFATEADVVGEVEKEGLRITIS